MNGVIYCRVPTRERVEGTSLDSQEQACLEYAAQKNASILKVSSDPERTWMSAIASDSLVANRATPGGVLRAAPGNITCLPHRTLADYGVGYGTHGRGTAGILCNLGKGFQGRDLNRRRPPLRLPAHRALRPAGETSAVGEEVFCAAA